MKSRDLFKKAAVGYLRHRVWAVIVFAVMAAVFYAVISQYRLNAAPVLYASALAGVMGAAACVADFILFFRKHAALTEITGSVFISIDGLPEGGSLIESDYQALVRLLHDEKRRAESESSRSIADMTEYYTIWAHQIKTPIAAMELMLQSGNAGSSALRAELFRIEQYVEMVLCYLRLESRSTDYLLRRYDLDPIVRQAVRKYAGMFIQKGIKLEYEGTPGSMLTDEKWLLFVIEQVLSNAIKYTHAGKVSIYMESDRLIVEDTGIGIDQGDLPRIFSRSFTGYNGREDKRASGLGLYLSREILRRLSHTIEIESELGVGTKVMIGFPNEMVIPD